MPQHTEQSHFRFPALLLHRFEGLQPGKTGRFDESIVLDSPWMQTWIASQLEALLLGKGASQSLWPWSHAEFLTQYKSACSELALTARGLTVAVYGLRHGGASHDTLAELRTFEQVKERGRWASDRSVHRYRKASLAQAEVQKLHLQHQRLASRLMKDLGALFRPGAAKQNLMVSLNLG